jgi:hypothetical protein
MRLLDTLRNTPLSDDQRQQILDGALSGTRVLTQEKDKALKEIKEGLEKIE